MTGAPHFNRVAACKTYLHLRALGLDNTDTLQQLGIDINTVNRYLAEVRQDKEKRQQ